MASCVGSRAALVLGLLLFLGAVGLRVTDSYDNGLALTPPMGWNTWNAFGVNIDEEVIKEMANHIVGQGFRDAGYTYLNLDDAWSDPRRDAQHKLVANTARFPSGIRALADYVHSQGLKFGIYSDAGPLTCAGFPGSRFHEVADAQSFADWGVDYLKYDNCWAPPTDQVVKRYTAMRDALNATGRPILFSLCEWGVADPWLWASEVGNTWRTTGDIAPNWLDLLRCLDNTVGLARFAGRSSGWNDPDMLEVGNPGLSILEQRSHFALWAILKAPLLIGADLRWLSPASKAILLAKEVIAVNQDALGVAGDLVWKEGSNEVYAGPLKGGARAVVLFNRHVAGQYPLWNLTVKWSDVGFDNDLEVTVRDIFGQQDLGVFSGSYTHAIEAHDAMALRLIPVTSAPHLEDWRPWHTGPASRHHSIGMTSR